MGNYDDEFENKFRFTVFLMFLKAESLFTNILKMKLVMINPIFNGGECICKYSDTQISDD